MHFSVIKDVIWKIDFFDKLKVADWKHVNFQIILHHLVDFAVMMFILYALTFRQLCNISSKDLGWIKLTNVVLLNSEWLLRVILFQRRIKNLSPCSVRMRENTDQKKLRIWTLFTKWKFPQILNSVLVTQPVVFSDSQTNMQEQSLRRCSVKKM